MRAITSVDPPAANPTTIVMGRAKARREALDRGEDVPGGLGRRENFEDMLKRCGLTTNDIRECRRVAEISDLGGWDEFIAEVHKRRDASERAASRAMLRRLRQRARG
jgi:hypothetical protein